MNARDEERKAMIDKMLQTRTERAEKAADAWLKDNPDDPRVIAAEERLSRRGAKLRDPERTLDPMTLTVFVVLFLPATLVLGALTDDWYVAAAAAAGSMIAGLNTELVGGLLYESSARRTEER